MIQRNELSGRSKDMYHTTEGVIASPSFLYIDSNSSIGIIKVYQIYLFVPGYGRIGQYAMLQARTLVFDLIRNNMSYSEAQVFYGITRLYLIRPKFS